jgi:hypothetical protein
MARSNFAEVAARAARAARRRDDKRDISSKNVRRVTEKSSNFGFRAQEACGHLEFYHLCMQKCLQYNHSAASFQPAT